MMNEEALGWVIRTRDPEFADWEAFTGWLEADPAHAAVYDALMAADADLAEIVPAEPVSIAVPANDAGPRGWKPMRWPKFAMAGGAVAAALAGVVSLHLMNRPDIYTVTTRPGETRTVALDDGTRVELNGGTTMRFDRRDARFAALDGGEAAFTVRHDAANPFRVTVGEAVFEDAGTVFNIVHSGSMTRIGVSEGEVIYNPKAEAIALPAGRALTHDESGLRVMDIATDSVASWRQGRLTYANAPVAQISGDIARSLGVKLDATPGAGAMRFTGTIRLDRDPVRFFGQAAPLMGLRAVRQGDVWLLKEGDGPPR
ncbi:iron dicitrate transport regulator FecR [Sphingobium sp. LB126]|uniref:FecR family protein n=1 Tax=Sphingobium sp. LB126 TaxID=1983755 RepID=UPI000C200830|nr:FecR domain-containing protein [Sphingobium sp. LB126]PJG49372.1 iron dicitrate transport regulator FecR [Sphingobium sp. LB126]